MTSTALSIYDIIFPYLSDVAARMFPIIHCTALESYTTNSIETWLVSHQGRPWTTQHIKNQREEKQYCKQDWKEVWQNSL
jgi:hypothetical protein